MMSKAITQSHKDTRTVRKPPRRGQVRGKGLYCIILFALTLSGCASIPLTTPQLPAGTGIYHRIEKGQTLWKISKMYNVDLEDLAGINHVFDATNIEIGQLIFIPNRQKKIYGSPKYSSDDFLWPLKGRVIAGFGQTFNNIIVKGINIQPSDNPNVYASRAGRVIFYNENFGGFGKTIIIDHKDGLSSVYSRNSEVFAKTGDNVEKGAIIAKAGSAGRDKNTYLHFEIRSGHIPKNPLFYLP